MIYCGLVNVYRVVCIKFLFFDWWGVMCVVVIKGKKCGYVEFLFGVINKFCNVLFV